MKNLINIIILFLLFGCNNEVKKETSSSAFHKTDTLLSVKKNNLITETSKDTSLILDGIQYDISIKTNVVHKNNDIAINNALLKILKNNEVLFERTYDKNYFKITDSAFLNRASIYQFSFSKYDNKREFEFFCAIGVPETDWSYAFELFINKSGFQRAFELTDEGEELERLDLGE